MTKEGEGQSPRGSKGGEISHRAWGLLTAGTRPSQSAHLSTESSSGRQQQMGLGAVARSQGQTQGVCGPLRGAGDTYLSQLVVLNQLWSVPVDQGIESKTVLPAGDGKAKVMSGAPPPSWEGCRLWAPTGMIITPTQ